jgi:hypothetical protein
MAVIWISTGRNVGELNGSRAKMDLFFLERRDYKSLLFLFFHCLLWYSTLLISRTYNVKGVCVDKQL